MLKVESKIVNSFDSLKTLTASHSIFLTPIPLQYQKGALATFENLQFLTSAFTTCQKEYLRSNEQFLTSIFLDSFNGDSPSLGPEKMQSKTFVYLELYKALSSSNV